MAFNAISCGIAVGKVGTRISGFDPRNIIKSCMWSTLSKGKGGKNFRNCLEKKIKQNVHDIENPEEFVSEIWQKIKKNCT